MNFPKHNLQKANRMKSGLFCEIALSFKDEFCKCKCYFIAISAVKNYLYSPHSSSLIAHQARTSLRVCVSHQRSPTGAFTCPRSTRGTAATSNTTAPHRPTSSALMLEAPAQVASLGRGGRSEGNLMRCTVTSASRSPQVPSTPLAFGRPRTWALAGMGPVLSRSAVPTTRPPPPCPLTLSLPQTVSRWKQPWRRSTAGARGPR